MSTIQKNPRGSSTGIRPPITHAASPANTGLNTRQTVRMPITQAEIEAIPNKVMDHLSTEKYLSQILISLSNEPYMLTHLTLILLHITQLPGNTPMHVIAAIRTVTFILKKHTACEIAETAAKQVVDTLSTRIVNSVITAIAPQVATVLHSSESLVTTLKQADELYHSMKMEHDTRDAEHNEKEESVHIAAEHIEEAADTLFTSVKDCQNALKTLSPSLDATQERINFLSMQMLSMPPSQPQETLRPTYSSMAAAHLPPMIDQAVGRAAIHARQILLDPRPGDALFPPNTSHLHIAKKLKEALSNIRDNTTPAGDIKAVYALHNGGIIVELENENLAAWLQGPIGRTLMEG
ncbi:hypothetical protein DFH29DRAFT_1007803 [Suillus ampliporus]|nr:hypothetical protein DFH29DRAFT_1007803 [Suillus ampliporus]